MTADRKTRWEKVIAGGGEGALDRLMLSGMGALSVAYGGALRLHLGAYRLGLARRLRLPALVISIGNITVGGTGKTTATIAVARWLSDRGKRVAVLSRGYRGSSERKAMVVSEGVGPLVSAQVAGDEPYLLARTLPGVSVLVGRDRRQTGRLAVERLGAEVVLLDDGFQYQRLAKDVEIVLVDALSPFGYDSLVPRGLLREPPANLARADAVWITHSDLVRESDLLAIRERILGYAPGARLRETRHAPVRLQRLTGGDELPPEAVRGQRVTALSGIGNPAAFQRTLEQIGAVLTEHVRFPDHHPYQAAEIRELIASRAANAEMIVTTPKDAVRIPADCLDNRVWVLEVELAERPGGPPLSKEAEWLLTAKAQS